MSGQAAPPVDLAAIQAAAARIRTSVVRTPTLLSETLSQIAGCNLTLKFENLQYTASFKDRGAANALLTLPDDSRRRGVIAMSAGNHAQAVAYHASRLGIASTIVMPRHTPHVKTENTRRLGASVVLKGDTVDDAGQFAREHAAIEGLTLVHPFDNAAVIAGQGSIALEMLADAPDLDTLVVPIGGGGLIGGIATAAKALKPDIRIIGVEASLYPSAYNARHATDKECGGSTIADGIAVKRPGSLTLPIIDRLVDDLVLVEESDLEAAVVRLLEIEKTIVEGAGAASLAAVFRYPELFEGRNVGIVLCGGNIDARLLSDVILRGLVRSQRLIRLRIGVPDRPGSLAAAATCIADLGGNVIDVTHHRAFSTLSVKATAMEVTIETRGGDHAHQLMDGLHSSGFAVDLLGPAGNA